jgi:hypothetical protein
MVGAVGPDQEDPQHPDETPLRSFLERRERELTHQLAALRGRIESKERELAEIKKVRATLTSAPPSPPDNTSVEVAADVVRAAGNQRSVDLINQTGNVQVSGPPPLNEKLTIKEMIVAALRSHFHDGARPAELRTFIQDVWDRKIDRTSLGPQLARLREEGILEQSGTKWRISERERQRGVVPQSPEET